MALSVASSSSAQLAYIREATMGTTPTTGKGINLRMTGESLEQNISKEVSKEINPSRQTSGMYLTDAQVSGGWQIELSAGEYDPFLEALLMGTWSAFGTNGKTAAESVTFAAAPANTITFTNAPAGLADLRDGCWISFGGTGLSDANKKPLRVKSVNAGQKQITVYNSLTAQTVADAVCYHGRLTNGTTKRSFSFEKLASDLNQSFQYRGCQISKGSFNFESKNAVTGSFEIIGMTAGNSTGRQLGDKTAYTNSQVGPIMDAVLGMDGVLINGEDVRTRMTAGIQKLSLEFDNQMKGHDAVGVLGNVDVTAGTIMCNVNISMYFQTGAIYNDVIRQVRHNICWYVFDSNGRGYAFTLPSVELKTVKTNFTDNDSPVMAELEGQALMHPTLGKTIFIDRF